MKSLLAVLVAIVCFTTSPAAAQDLSAAEVYDMCSAARCYEYPWTSPDWREDQALCVLADRRACADIVMRYANTTTCAFETTRNALIQAFLLGVQRDPALLGGSAWNAARTIVQRTFCPLTRD